jgi:hypothetical protein
MGLLRYCQEEGLSFTRSRPYKNNDQAHVEQKNWMAVRRLIGYERYESVEALALLEAIYSDWRRFVNLFQPVRKLLRKERVGSKVRKRYDRPRPLTSGCWLLRMCGRSGRSSCGRSIQDAAATDRGEPRGTVEAPWVTLIVRHRHRPR